MQHVHCSGKNRSRAAIAQPICSASITHHPESVRSNADFSDCAYLDRSRTHLCRSGVWVGFLLSGLESPTDPEHAAIGMTKVHLADVPRHIGGRKCDLQPGSDALLVHLIHIVHLDRHPDTLVALFARSC